MFLSITKLILLLFYVKSFPTANQGVEPFHGLKRIAPNQGFLCCFQVVKGETHNTPKRQRWDGQDNSNDRLRIGIFLSRP